MRQDRAMGDKDRDRFVALAFCRADLLFELDGQMRILFATGAGAEFLDGGADGLRGRSFFDLIARSDRRLAMEFLDAARDQGRVDDVVVRLQGRDGAQPLAVVAGYQVPDFEDHFFIAIKFNPVFLTEPPPEVHLSRDEETGLMSETAFATLAAERGLALQRAGGWPQLTLIQIDEIDGLARRLKASDRRDLLCAVGDILSNASLGGATAARLSPSAFGYLHSDTVEPESVNQSISQAASLLFPSVTLRPRAHTLDADGAGMSEEQVAKAIAHTIRQYCEGGAAPRQNSLAQALKGMVSATIDTVAFLRKAVAECDFGLVFMPVCDLATHRIVHFEALTRFRDGRTDPSPYPLFLLAEEIGIIHDLDLAICEMAIRKVQSLLQRGRPFPPVAINLSGLSIADTDFVGKLWQLLARYHTPPAKILFEVTESARIVDLAAANGAIRRFRQAGFRFCLDDFGAGAASFDYLNALDVDIVKFDGPVVKRACASRKGSELLASMTRMCSDMGIRTCAEMIEDARAAARVSACGVSLGQGTYFGYPRADLLSYANRFPRL